MRGLALVALIASACVTTRDAVGGGDARLDEATRPEAETVGKNVAACGRDGAGDVVVLDGRTGGPLTCLELTVSTEPASCPAGTECPTTVVFRGRTNRQGQLPLPAPVSGARVIAVAEGFAPAQLANATTKPNSLIELELMPGDGYWLKVLDAEGNYLPDVTVTFRQGDSVIAQVRTNVLANVLFSQRQPFSGEPVTVEAAGFQALTVSGVGELGDDGHTLTLRR